jgi:hypothetical protein
MKTMGVLLAALLLAGCSGEAADVDGIESTITRQMQRQLHGKAAKVACPDDIEWQAGSEFHCLAKAGGRSYRVTVSMENDADWTWTTG